MENISWNKDPVLLRRKDGGYILVIGSMFYRFDDKGSLDHAEKLTDGILKIIMGSIEERPALKPLVEVAARMKTRLKGKTNGQAQK